MNRPLISNLCPVARFILITIIAGVMAITGSTSSSSAEETFSAGAVSVDITPGIGCALSGYAVEGGRNATGVMHPLKAQIVVFSDSKSTAAIVTLDLLNLHLDTVNLMRTRIQSLTGIPGDHVAFASSHTHAGPLVGETFPEGTEPKPDPEYMTLLTEKIPAGVKEAFGKMAAATLEYGAGRSNININRRFPAGGKIEMRPNPLRIVDQRVKVLIFRSRETGYPLAVLFNIPCHPNVMRGDNTLISGDFPSPAKFLVENTLGHGCVALFAQGCTGDIRPNFLTPDGLNFGSGKREDVEKLGRQLGTEVVRVVSEASSPVAETEIDAATSVLSLSLKKGGVAHSQVQAIRIGTLWVVTLPGEPMVELGLQIEDKVAGNVLVFGYSNDSVGYLCTEKSFSEGGYEPTSSYVSKESEGIIVSTVVGLTQKMKTE